MAARTTFVSLCKTEKLAFGATVAEVDAVLAETGCATQGGPGGPAFSIRKEAAATTVWLRAHAADSAAQFDALPDACKEGIKGLYGVSRDAPGVHWAKRILRIMKASMAPDSPAKQDQQPESEQGELGMGQSRPDKEGEAGDSDKAREEKEQSDRRRREDDVLLETARQSWEAKRQKDASVLSPESLKNLALGKGGAGAGPVRMQWLPRKTLEENLPPWVLAALWLAGNWKQEAVNRALKSEQQGLHAPAMGDGSSQLWAHRLRFFLGVDARDAPDLNIVGKNLALVTKMALAGREEPLEKIVTIQMRADWGRLQDQLALAHQVPESELRAPQRAINDMMKKRERILRVAVMGCGVAGEEVAKAAANQTREVGDMWECMVEGVAADFLSSPTKTTVNAMWMTVLAPAMDQRTGSAPSGDTSLAPAQARLSARLAAEGGAKDPVRRRLASALAQTVAAPPQALAAQPAPAAAWPQAPAWGPPPPAYMAPSVAWLQPQQPMAPPPLSAPARVLPPPSSAPPPLPAPPAARPAAKIKSDGWTGQPASTAMLGDRGVIEAEDAPAKNHCAMCLRANPQPRLHLAWECAIKLARRAGGEPCPGFDAQGNRVPSAWTLDGNLQLATVQAWGTYIDRWGLEVAGSAPGPPHLS